MAAQPTTTTAAIAAASMNEHGVSDGTAVGTAELAVASAATGLSLNENKTDRAAAAVDDGGVAQAAGRRLSGAGSSKELVAKGRSGDQPSESTPAAPEEEGLGPEVKLY